MKKFLTILILSYSLLNCSGPVKELSREDKWTIESLKSKAFADSLNSFINYDSIVSSVEGMVNDSTHPYIEIIRKDTQTIYSTGGIRPITRTEYLEKTKSERFGKTAFYGGIDYQGKINYLTFSKRTYYSNSGNLYMLNDEEKYRICNDSLKNGQLESLTIKNATNCLMSKSEIAGSIDIENIRFYKIFLSGMCGNSKLEQYLIIDENLRIIENIHLRKSINRKIKTLSNTK